MEYGVYFRKESDGKSIALTRGLSKEECKKIQIQLKRLHKYDEARKIIEKRIIELTKVINPSYGEIGKRTPYNYETLEFDVLNNILELFGYKIE